ncbi:hypothetical protein [Stenomitos frigidus]|uniref:Uncharacterized protein n=1 Tax=Stenomitos frigidus ULC18 TaxID=2107698 RepID=A0A2T1DWF9_9CYAN|nr:hypothetical protein [Stenomitos frigidus]PSB24827.1 hypothetical protein C7B82_25865 [Stenomitos frigidus ULC18]
MKFIKCQGLRKNRVASGNDAVGACGLHPAIASPPDAITLQSGSATSSSVRSPSVVGHQSVAATDDRTLTQAFTKLLVPQFARLKASDS